MPEQQKIRIAVLFGGPSGEHDVSMSSAASILTNLRSDRYDVVGVRIGRDGVWTAAEMPELDSVEAVLDWQHTGFPEVSGETRADSLLTVMPELMRCDVALPALHGPFGEDGTLQALLEGLGVPLVGNGVAASALSMDKEHTKTVAASVQLDVCPSVVLHDDETDVSAQQREQLGLPVFVKPAREGSSIGVSKIDDWAELPTAVEAARKSDEKVLVEAAAEGREVDIGVLELPGGELTVSPPMEILASDTHAFFDYTAKYGDADTVFDVPAKLTGDVTGSLGRDAVRLFRALGCAGLLRVDFFVRPDGSRVVNEVNTFPGFTTASQYPRMWQAAGLSYGELLDVLVDTALWRAARD